MLLTAARSIEEHHDRWRATDPPSNNELARA
jgi:hypothetical protein